MRVTLATALLSASASAWSINGHYFVANIAKDFLSLHHKKTHDAVESMLMVLVDKDPGVIKYEATHHFVEAATFADDIKYGSGPWNAPYHFIDIAYIAEGKESDYVIPDEPQNLTVGIPNLVAWLSGKDGDSYLQSDIYAHITSQYPDDEDTAKSYALRLLIHYYGDIHQPFHCEARFNSENKTGDKGANTFPLKYHYGVDELHALWDEILYEGYPHQSRPFTDETYDEFQLKVQDLEERNTAAVEKKSLYENLDWDSWSKDSFAIAKTLYSGITENELPSQDYINDGKLIAESQIMLGGYRLAYGLNHIFGTSNEEDDHTAIADILSAFLQ